MGDWRKGNASKMGQDREVVKQFTRRQALAIGSAAGVGAMAAASPDAASAAYGTMGDWDYLITPTDSGGCQALNGTTGVVDYSTTSTSDHAPVFQSAVNNLLSGGGPTGGVGGKIAFKGSVQFASQLVIYPNIALVGQAPLGYKPGASYGPVITSSYNGSALVVTDDLRGSTFVYLADFALYGASGLASQNGIEWNVSGPGGAVFDSHVDRVLVFHMGQHGFLIAAPGAKVWLTGVYAERSAGDGIRQASGQIRVVDSYIEGNGGHGVNAATGTATWILDSTFYSNVGCAVYIQTNQQTVVIGGNTFGNNGGGNFPALQVNNMAGANSEAVLSGNAFRDDRGSTAAPAFIRAANGNVVRGLTVSGNSFSGTRPISVSPRAGNGIVIKGNQGFNDTRGQVSNPFDTATGRMGIEGTASSPSASTVYTVGCTDLMLSVSGGTGVSITIADPIGTAIQTGLAAYSGVLPVGYTINFGGFSAAPNVYVGVV